MILIVTLQLFSMKVVVMVETYPGHNKLKPLQWLAFFSGWFGMRAQLFEKLPSPALQYGSLIAKGLSRIAAGLLLVHLSQVAGSRFGDSIFFVPELLLLIGLSLILHFGILNLSPRCGDFSVWMSASYSDLHTNQLHCRSFGAGDGTSPFLK